MYCLCFLQIPYFEVIDIAKSQKRSINFATDTLGALDRLAAQRHTTTSELVREYVDQGLSVEGYRQEVDFIAQIVRQEIQSVLCLGDIEKVVQKNADRIAKMHMKTGKLDAAAFFLLIKVLMNLSSEGSEIAFEEMLSDAVGLGVDYMQKKDFQINRFLEDAAHLRGLAENL